MSCPEMQDEFEDSQTSLQLIITKIGHIAKGVDGTDEYLLVTCREHDISPQQVHDELMPRYYRATNRAGGYFCTSISVFPANTDVIAVIHHQFDC